MRITPVVTLTILSTLVFSCTSIRPPGQVLFEVNPDVAVLGDSVTVGWQLFDDDAKRFQVLLDGQGVTTNGSVRLVPQAPSQSFVLSVKQNEVVVYNDTVTVRVESKPPAEPPRISMPEEEKVNITPSKYAAGLVNEEGNSTGAITCDVFGVDVSEFPNKVRVLVSVKDANGNLLANLAPPYNNQRRDFWKSVVETHAGKNIEITDFTVTEQRKVDWKPKTVCFVGDYSGSMSSSIGDLDAAIEMGMRALRTSDDYTLVQFDHDVHIVTTGSQGGASTRRIPFASLGGATAFYDASVDGLRASGTSSKERIAILFTDGQDNSSYLTSASDVVRAAFLQHARTYIIAFGGADSSVMAQIARYTHGKLYSPQSAAEFKSIYDEIFRTLTTHYVIEYTGKKSNTDHRVSVTINPRKGESYTSTREYFEEPKLILENRAYLAGLFGTGSSLLAEPDKWDSRLQELVKLSMQNPDKSIVIRAHTDTRGADRANEKLSAKRARFIARELERRGIRAKRLVIEAIGEQQPVHSNDEEDWQQQENRRVEILFN